MHFQILKLKILSFFYKGETLMTHKMKLQPAPFESIKKGSKTIEMRLYDEKRQLVKAGDIIEFTNMSNGETLSAQVLALHFFPSFADLYKHFDKISLGYRENETADPNDMAQFYTKEEQSKYGVVGIEIQKL